MRNTPTFDEAWTKGFFKPLGSAAGSSFSAAPSRADPFFTGLGSGTIIGMDVGMYHYPVFAQINFAMLTKLSIWATALITVNRYNKGYKQINTSLCSDGDAKVCFWYSRKSGSISFL